MKKVVTLRGGSPWGFRIVGGYDHRTKLVISKTTFGGKADVAGLKASDEILAINNEDASTMTHDQAKNAVKNAGTMLIIQVLSKDNVPMTKLTSTMNNVTIKPANDVTKTSNDVTTDLPPPDLPPPPTDLLDDLPPPPQNFPDPPTPTAATPASIPPPPPVVAAPKVSSSKYVTGIPYKPKKPLENSTPSKFVTPYKPPATTAPVAKENKAPPKSVSFKPTAPSDFVSAAPYKPPSWPRSKGPAPSLADLIMQDDVNKSNAPVKQQKSPVKQPAANLPAEKSPVKTPPAAKSPAATTPPAAKPKDVYTPPDFVTDPSNGGKRDDSPPQNRKSSKSVQDKIVCAECLQEITGAYVSAMNKTYMPECFTCHQCGKFLQDCGFVNEGNRRLCEVCYKGSYAKKCKKCKCEINGDAVRALDEHWCVGCFSCTSCGCSFDKTGFIVNDGMPYCQLCYDRMFSILCTGCGCSIGAGGDYVQTEGKNYCGTCFKCHKCSRELRSNQFYFSKGSLLCANCP